MRQNKGHVEICLKEVGIEEHSRDVSTPVDKSARDPKNRDEIVNSIENNHVLNPSMTTTDRAIVARLDYLGQDRIEIQFAVKDWHET